MEDVRTGDWRLFSPSLGDNGFAYAELVEIGSKPPGEAVPALSELIQRPVTTQSGLRRTAAALVLRDLISLGWQILRSGGWLYVRPSPPGAFTKDHARRQLEFGRNDQLAEPSTRKFIHSLERPKRSSGLRPVTDLIADGRALESDLRGVLMLTGTDQLAALQRVCQPYSQLVTTESRDAYTNLRLMDIWRYFRHGWTTRYRSSPGRNLFYLIRDAARPNHPIIAITALGNTVMQLGPRDDAIGWTVEGVKRAISDGRVSGNELLIAFRKRVEDDYSEIFTDDLPVPPFLTSVVPPDVLDRLSVIDRRASEDRTDRLRDTDDDVDSTGRIDDVEDADLEAMARSPLFLAKRARLLRVLLTTYAELRRSESFSELLQTHDGIRAISHTLRQMKKRFVATSMMEITVCGAIAPYNHILGGKLACLMMLSPGVRCDYERRYRDSYSIIASQMAGRKLRKPPILALLGTSSLYPGRSSQYNRVRLPAGTCIGQTTSVEYKKLGDSEGFGSPNLSAETEFALEALSERAREYRNVNFVFGEGQSPKFRQLREGFAALGLGRSNVLNHGTQRVIYGVDLVQNATRLLLGVDTVPEFRIPDAPDAEELIVGFWRSRWLAARLRHGPALAAVATSSPLSERISRLIPDRADAATTDLFNQPQPEGRSMASTLEDEKLAFVRQLYRDESAYSDHVKIGRLRELNVRTKVDDVVRRVIRAGGSVVITGNAGDGKTHVIRLLENDLRAANAKVVVDASAVSHDEIIASWRAARDASVPFCIAINEGPLIELIRQRSTDAPWLADVHSQILGTVTYVPVDQEVDDRFQPAAEAVVVIDLSLRHTLAPELVGAVIDKLTDDMWYTNCAECPHSASCSVHINRTTLREPLVKRRTTELLERVGERGLRATFRELLGFVSYLIFGGRRCADLLADGPSEFTRYSWLAFEGQGAIFEEIGGGLDPVLQTMPHVDEDLWRGRYNPGDFVGHGVSPALKRDLDDIRRHDEEQATDAFTALKRRWYFEHPDGKLRHATRADRAFSELQNADSSSQLRVGRLIALINGWRNKADRNQQDNLRLWTRLSYSPRARGSAIVSGRGVSNLQLQLFKPRLTPALRAAFGRQAPDHLLLAPPGNVRFANLLVDRHLLELLMSIGAADSAEDVDRRLGRFNDALEHHAEVGSHVRTIEILDPESELQVRVRVDLAQRRYDSAE